MQLKTCFVLLAACTETEQATVSGIRVPCTLFVTEMCLELDDGEVVHGIDGFTPRWGVDAVEQFHREAGNPDNHDSPREYLVLDALIEERPVASTEFVMEFPSGPSWFRMRGSALELADFTSVECDEPTRAAILDASGIGMPFGVRFEILDENRLRAIGIE
jgi:hypothetical protein